jgi:lipid-binding SYLF domain-containing protein
MKPHLAALALILTAATASANLDAVVQKATGIFSDKQGSSSPIPQEALDAALGVAIVDITKGGVVFGGTGGSGVVLLKQKQGLKGFFGMKSWSAPIPITFSGGSFGAQIGGSTTKAIVLLNSEAAVSKFTNPGKIGWSASASGTAGSDTEREQKGGLLSDVDVKMYEQTEGLYAGAVFGGTSLAIDQNSLTQAYGANVYVRDILEGRVKTPASAERLVSLLNGKR